MAPIATQNGPNWSPKRPGLPTAHEGLEHYTEGQRKLSERPRAAQRELQECPKGRQGSPAA
eukprot:9484393-Pyramimonas_sp.AAC.1